jgi:hypothetical protein
MAVRKIGTDAVFDLRRRGRHENADAWLAAKQKRWDQQAVVIAQNNEREAARMAQFAEREQHRKAARGNGRGAVP